MSSILIIGTIKSKQMKQYKFELLFNILGVISKVLIISVGLVYFILICKIFIDISLSLLNN